MTNIKCAARQGTGFRSTRIPLLLIPALTLCGCSALNGILGADDETSSRNDDAALASPPQQAPRSRLLVEGLNFGPLPDKEGSAPSPAVPKPRDDDDRFSSGDGATAAADPTAEAPPPEEASDAGVETQSEIILPAGRLEDDQPAPPRSAAHVNEAAPPAAAPTADEDTPEQLRLVFEQDAVDLNDPMRESLLVLAHQLRDHEELHISMLAYASGSDDDPARSRRISLSRALAVRAFLLDQGVRPTRMDVQAVGRPPGDEPADRVDLLPAPPGGPDVGN